MPIYSTNINLLKRKKQAVIPNSTQGETMSIIYGADVSAPHIHQPKDEPKQEPQTPLNAEAPIATVPDAEVSAPVEPEPEKEQNVEESSSSIPEPEPESEVVAPAADEEVPEADVTTDDRWEDEYKDLSADAPSEEEDRDTYSESESEWHDDVPEYHHED